MYLSNIDSKNTFFRVRAELIKKLKNWI